MAKSKALKKPQKSTWVRTGGFIGDDSMDRMDQYMQDGCGVQEKEKVVHDMPNEEFVNKKVRPGVE